VQLPSIGDSYFPLGHEAQKKEPSEVVVVPGGHVSQAAAAVKLLKVPIGHFIQVYEFGSLALRYSPGGQGIQSVAFPTDM
jgi:hypothetical protein